MVAHRPLPEIHLSNLEWSTPQPPTDTSPRRLSPDSKRSDTSSPLSFQQKQRHSSTLFSESKSQNSLSLLGAQSNNSIDRHRSRSPFSSPSRIRNSLNDGFKGKNIIDVDPYRILGLNRDDTFEDVKKAYRRLALLCHPKRSGTTSQDRSARSHKIVSNRRDDIQSFYSIGRGESFTCREDRTGEDGYNEESIREWHFIVVAASYETLYNVEHRRQYDYIWKQSQLCLSNRKSKHRRKKGFWKSFRKGLDNGLDIKESFDSNDGKNKEDGLDGEVECGCVNENDNGPSSLFGVCGSMESRRKNVTDTSAKDNQAIVSKLLSPKGGKKVLLNCQPLLLSDDENSQRQKSTGTEASNVTEEDNYDDDFVREETNHLFGGPLAPMYKARKYQPFSDAFDLFRYEFGSDIFRSRSCFDDDDEDDAEPNNDFAKQWIAGGNGRILEESNTVSSSNHTPSSISLKPTFVYPVLPNIPLSVLDQYGVLDGTVRHCKPEHINNNKSLTTKVLNERKNGVSSEIKITTKIHGSMRVVRTQTTTTDANGKKKTVTSVKRETIPIEELMKEEEEKLSKHEGFIDLVSCCSFSIPKENQRNVSRNIPDDVSVISSTSSKSTVLSMRNFEDKKALKLRMKKLFLAQKRYESREE